MRQTIAFAVFLLVAIACATAPVGAPDPAKLERAMQSLLKASDAVQAAIEDTRDALPQPETVEAESPELEVVDAGDSSSEGGSSGDSSSGG